MQNILILLTAGSLAKESISIGTLFKTLNKWSHAWRDTRWKKAKNRAGFEPTTPRWRHLLQPGLSYLNLLENRRGNSRGRRCRGWRRSWRTCPCRSRADTCSELHRLAAPSAGGTSSGRCGRSRGPREICNWATSLLTRVCCTRLTYLALSNRFKLLSC